eukprot:EG_transcript_3545
MARLSRTRIFGWLLSFAALCSLQPLFWYFHLSDVQAQAERPPWRPVNGGNASRVTGVTVVVPVLDLAAFAAVPRLLQSVGIHVQHRPLAVVLAAFEERAWDLPNASFPVTQLVVPQHYGRRWEVLCNFAASLAPHDTLLFLSPQVTVLNDVVTFAVKVLAADPSVGITGCAVVANASHGVTRFFSHGYDVAMVGLRQPCLTPRLRGYAAAAVPPALAPHAVAAVPHLCLMTRAVLFSELGGFDPRLPRHLTLSSSGPPLETAHQAAALDLCLRCCDAGHQVQVSPAVVALPMVEAIDMGEADDVRWTPAPGAHPGRAEAWAAAAMAWYRRTAADPATPPLELHWQPGTADRCHPHVREAASFAHILEDGGHYPSHLPGPTDGPCPGWPQALQLTVQRAAGTVIPLAESSDPLPIRMDILLQPPASNATPLLPRSSSSSAAEYRVLRLHPDHDPLPYDLQCLSGCASQDPVDEVWVPSWHAFRLLVARRVPERLLAVVPEPLDTMLFDPAAAAPPLPLPKTLYDWGWPTTDGPNSDIPPPHALEVRARHLKFLAILPLEPRSGWDVLVRAFAAAFAPDAPVSLYVIAPAAPPQPIADVWRQLRAAAPGARLPHLQATAVDVPETALPAVFRSVDVYVAPAREVAFGQRLLQAMAMGLPAIATAWAGHSDFVTPETAYLLNYTLQPVPPEHRHSTLATHWAEPSGPHLQQLLGLAKSHAGGAGDAKGPAARRAVMARFGEEALLAQLKARLDAARAKALYRRRRWSLHRAGQLLRRTSGGVRLYLAMVVVLLVWRLLASGPELWAAVRALCCGASPPL